jgi:hypothetical protein
LIWVNILPVLSGTQSYAPSDIAEFIASRIVSRHQGPCTFDFDQDSRLTEEASMPKPDSSAAALATRNDIKSILGDIDPAEMLAIIALKPTIADIEEASVWLDGDPDVFGAGKAVQGVTSEIVAILTENEEEEEPPHAG